MISLLLIVGYAVAITVALVAVYRRKADSDGLEAELLSLARQQGSIKERAEVVQALASVQSSQVRWYERAISTIGIVALATMTIATAVQTVQSAAQEKKLEEWERRAGEAERRVQETNWLIGSIAKLVVNRASRVALLSEDEKRILRYRFERLSEVPKLERADKQEMIQLSIVLREFFKGAALIENDLSLFESAEAADHVSLAEYYYLTGRLDQGRAMSDRAAARRYDLPEIIHLRLLVVRVLLKQERREDAIRVVASLQKKSVQEAEIVLDGEVAAFMDGAKRLRAAR